MITPNEVRSKKITTVESDGYDRNEVNQLLVEVIESYESVCTENKELYRKMEILANKIEEYREDEDSIKTVLISAQKMASHVTRDANSKAEEIIKQSEAEAEKIVNNANDNADKIIAEARVYVAELTKEKQEAANALVEQAEIKANTAISSAQLVAQDTIKKAKELTDEIVEKSKNEQSHYENVVAKLRAEAGEFKATLVALYETQLQKVKDLTKPTGDAESIKVLQDELDSIVTNINDLSDTDDILISEPFISQDDEQPLDDEQPSIETPENDEIADEIDEPQQVEEIEELDELDEVEDSDEVDEIINEIENAQPEFEEVDEEEETPTQEEIESALNAFSDNKITPVEGTGATIPVIEEEPELEFEKYFNIDRSQERTKETISLTSPDEDEEEETEKKFRGFFKKK